MAYPPSTVEQDAIRNQLAKVVQSRAFAKSPRTRNFLEFIVHQCLAGNEQVLKESVVGVEIFGKAPSWDSREDSTVRTGATRLRSKLRTYYQTEGREDAVVLQLEEGSYVPSFSFRKRESSGPPPAVVGAAEDPTRVVRSRRSALLAAIAAVLLAILLLTTYQHWRRSVASLRPTEPGSSRERLPDRIFAAAEAEGGTVRTLPVPGHPIRLVLSPNRGELYIIDNNGRPEIQVVDLERFALTRPISVPGRVVTVKLDNTGRTLYVATDTGGLHIIDRETSRRVVVQNGIDARIRDLALTPDGSRLYLALESAGLRRLDVPERRVVPVWTDRCPEFLGADPGGRYLYVSCGCGPGASTAHETVEIMDLATESTIRVLQGPPMIAGSIYVFPPGDRLWVEGLDACQNPRYQPFTRTGCPAFPGSIHNVFRVSDGSTVRVLGHPLEQALGAPEFAPDGARAITGGEPARVLDTTFFNAHEVFARDDTMLTAPAIDFRRRRVYFAGVSSGRIYELKLPLRDCDPPPLGRAHLWPGDGTLSDAAGTLHLTAAGNAAFSPGLIGRAFQLNNARLHVSTPYESLDGFTDEDGAIVGWLKLTGGGGGTVAGFRTQERELWKLSVGPDLHLTFEQFGRPSLRGAVPLRLGWRHLALVARGDLLTVYVDGAVSIQTRRFVRVGPQDLRELWLGPLAGLVDEVALYTRSLGAGELHDLIVSTRGCLFNQPHPERAIFPAGIRPIASSASPETP